MGYLALSDFRTDVGDALGNLGIDTARVDRYVNLGYLELCSMVLFEHLHSIETVSTANQTVSAALPAGTMVVKSVRHQAGDQKKLKKLPFAEYQRRPLVDAVPSPIYGRPTFWSRRGSLLYFYETPDGVYATDVSVYKAPALLAAPGDVTVLNAVWDKAVFELAVSNGLRNLGQEQRSGVWKTDAMLSIQAGLTEDELAVAASASLIPSRS